jgi:hypothetical protein
MMHDGNMKLIIRTMHVGIHKTYSLIKKKEKCDCNATNILVSISIQLNKKPTLIIHEAEDLMVLSTSHKSFQ